MSRVVHFYTVPADGSVLDEVVASGVEILSVKWRQDPSQPDPCEGEVVIYIEKPVEPAKGGYRAERRLKAFLVPTGQSFDQKDFHFVGTVRQPGCGQLGGSGFWHVYACLTEVDG